jgi:nucleotide-binding universal stress UspA family protein
VKVERIVLATDFSRSARAALEHAIPIAARFGARLYLFHVVDARGTEALGASGTEIQIDEFYEFAEERARAEVASLGGASEMRPGDLSIVECVRIGRPNEDIAQFASEKEADLIVVGTAGRKGLRRVIAGSVAESVVRRAPCPVLAVRLDRADAAAEQRAPVRKILVAVDSSPASRAALRAAHELARRFDAALVALNVLDDYVLAQASTLSQLDAVQIEASFAQLARAELDRIVLDATGGRAEHVERRLDVGTPAEAIARVAREVGADLVACGTHGRSGLRRALFGSVAEHVVRIAPCPVLVVREGKAASRLAA